MKKYTEAIKIILLIICLVWVTKSIEMLPWWSFVIPVLLFGVVISIKKWRVAGFGIGFIAGFIIWFGGNMYFDITQNGIVLQKIGLLISVPKIVVMLIAGIIGGTLTGLALYTGKSMLQKASAGYKSLD